MKKMMILSFFLCTSFCQAYTNYYVVPPPNAGIQSPYTNWVVAATNIQEVINLSFVGAGDTIYITNGHYDLTDQITVSKGVIIRSFNNGITDPTNTIIDGNNYVGKLVTNRCMNITAAATTTTVDGLTFTNGYGKYSNGDGGGGISVGGVGTLITNCIIIGNQARNEDPTPKYMSGGGIIIQVQCTIANCQIISNWAMYRGGGVCSYGANVILKNCFIGWNYNSASGAGVALGSVGGLVFNCDIVSNNGVAIDLCGNNGVVSNCTIRGNTNCIVFWPDSNSLGRSNLFTHCSIIDNYGASGVGGYVGYYTKVRNCLITRNRGTGNGGGLLIVDNQTGYVESCTIVSNYAPTAGGVYTYTGSSGIFSNTIVCSNTSSGSYKDIYAPGSTTNYFYNSLCKTVALPPAQGNITNDPVFVDFNSGNYRLARGSPCINAGENQDWMTGAFDLDQRRRLDKFSGRVDMGCYEYVPGGTMFTGR